QHRDLRHQQIGGSNSAQLFGRQENTETFAEGTVADLVVILDVGDEGSWRQLPARLATRPAAIRHYLALKGKAFGQGADKFSGVAEIVSVVTAILPSRGRMQTVVHVVIPLGGIGDGVTAIAAGERPRLVSLIFQNQ